MPGKSNENGGVVADDGKGRENDELLKALYETIRVSSHGALLWGMLPISLQRKLAYGDSDTHSHACFTVAHAHLTCP